MGQGYKFHPCCPNVLSSNEVGAVCVAAIDTGERLLGSAIGLVDTTTLRAAPGSIVRIDSNNGHTSQLRLVGHELAKLTERPPVQTIALCPSGLNPLANVRQVFNGNRGAGAFGTSSLEIR